MPVAQTVTVINKSGNVVKNSKYFVGVFKEAKAAYRERKAEIKAIRTADLDEKEKRRGLKQLDVDDDELDSPSTRTSRRSSRRSSYESSPTTKGRPLPLPERPLPLPDRPKHLRVDSHDSARSGRSSRSGRESPRPPKSPRHHGRSKLRFEDHLSDRPSSEVRGKELVRRNTDSALRQQEDEHRAPKSTRSASLSELEMSLAYGDMPVQKRPKAGALARTTEENELRNQVSKLQQMLDEAECAKSSVTAIIKNLSNNPDQLAAVALTLGEISTMAAKMGPAALTSLKVSAPGVVALLAAPEFAIAAGVGVGVTVIAFGGYKIIKRIKKKKSERTARALAAGDGADEDDEDEEDDDELQEIKSDLTRIELWRRGIADAQADGATSVSGEFVTPIAGQRLIEDGELKESDLKIKRSKTEKQKKEGKKEKEKEKERRRRNSDGEDSVLDRGKAFLKDPNSIKSLFKKDKKEKKELVLA